MSVPMKAYVDARVSGLLWLGVSVVIGFSALLVTVDYKNGRAVDRMVAAQKEATLVAFDAAEAKGVQHNGLIERMREMASHYITRGNVYSALIAAGVVVGIYSQIRG